VGIDYRDVHDGGHRREEPRCCKTRCRGHWTPTVEDGEGEAGRSATTGICAG
jgi:hypothetical protein